MRHNTDSFTTPDEIHIHTEHWLPDSNMQGIVLLAHGISEHIGRYNHVASALVDAGYGVYGHDHRGHGQSSGERVHTDSHSHFSDDLKRYYDRVRAQHPDTNIYLLGHSMGSVISLQFVLEYQPALDGLIVTGTATDVVSTVSPLLRTVVNALHPVFPKMPVSPPLDNPATLTSDPTMQARWQQDPHIQSGWTNASMAKYIVDVGEMIQQRASELTLPLLIMHGADDQITPISGSHIVYERAATEDKTLKIWDAMQHEILNERERNAVIQTLIDWLNAH